MKNTSSSNKKSLAMIAAVIVVVLLVLAVITWMNNPTRTLNKFVAAIDSGNKAAAWDLVKEDLKADKRSNVRWFLEDWLIADDLEYTFDRDESWRARVKTTTDSNGNEVAVVNKYGYEKLEYDPTPKYIAHHYQAYATFSFDGLEDPVIIKLKRKNSSTWSRLMQPFSGWEVTNIKYQPLDDEDLELLDSEADDEFEIVTEDETVVDESEDTADDEAAADDTTEEEDGLVEPNDDTTTDDAEDSI